MEIEDTYFNRKQKNAITKIETWEGDSLLYKWLHEWINPPPLIIGSTPREWPRNWVSEPGMETFEL